MPWPAAGPAQAQWGRHCDSRSGFRRRLELGCQWPAPAAANGDSDGHHSSWARDRRRARTPSPGARLYLRVVVTRPARPASVRAARRRRATGTVTVTAAAAAAFPAGPGRRRPAAPMTQSKPASPTVTGPGKLELEFQIDFRVNSVTFKSMPPVTPATVWPQCPGPGGRGPAAAAAAGRAPGDSDSESD